MEPRFTNVLGVPLFLPLLLQHDAIVYYHATNFRELALHRHVVVLLRIKHWLKARGVGLKKKERDETEEAWRECNECSTPD